ncbi:PREDICTED: VITISV_032574, partial [Prunus dulcis]
GGQLDNPHNEDHEERRSVTHSRRTNSRRQATENLSQAQSTNTPTRQRRREGRPSEDNEEVSQSRGGRQRNKLAMCAEDVEKLVNDRLRDLKTGGNFEDSLRKEMDQVNSTPFTLDIEQAVHPKRFSTPSFIHFKGDSDPESHLKHFKSVMILHQADDALMCKVFAMTLLGAAQDWFHTLPSRSISSFKELAYVFTKEYTSYRMIKKNPDHLFNLQKKYEESLRDYIKRFKAERANIIGCDDQIASSAFKRGLPIECELYCKLTISPCQTLVEVFATAERYALWDDHRTVAKKAAKQADQPVEPTSQRNDMIKDKDGGKRELQPQGGAPTTETYTKFTIPIQQILAQ